MNCTWPPSAEVTTRQNFANLRNKRKDSEGYVDNLYTLVDTREIIHYVANNLTEKNI